MNIEQQITSFFKSLVPQIEEAILADKYEIVSKESNYIYINVLGTRIAVHTDGKVFYIKWNNDNVYLSQILTLPKEVVTKLLTFTEAQQEIVNADIDKQIAKLQASKG